MQPAGGCEGFGWWKAVVGGGIGQAVDPELIAFVRPDDGQLQALGQFGRGTRMVDVAVGDPDLLERHAQLLDGRQQHRQVATRVDDGRFFRVIAPDDGAVLLEGRDGNGFVVQHKRLNQSVKA